MPPKKKKTKKAKDTDKASEDEEPVRKSPKRRKDCPDCGSTNIIFDVETERLICQDCGLIFEELPQDMGQKYEELDLI